MADANRQTAVLIILLLVLILGLMVLLAAGTPLASDNGDIPPGPAEVTAEPESMPDAVTEDTPERTPEATDETDESAVSPAGRVILLAGGWW